MLDNFDVIVVGGGHAGVEACYAASRRGYKTLLITLNFKMVANMPCNPSIGGSAKGIVVREIDALGGIMGKGADHEYLQMKMLNTKKGPGVQCLRAQVDKLRYPHFIQETLKKQKNLTILEDQVIEILTEENAVIGVKTLQNSTIFSKTVILATGTYMDSEILVGHEKWSGGPDGEKPAIGISDSLRKLGIKLIRLKTGTPQRIAKESIDFSKTTIQYGNTDDEGFSYESQDFIPIEEQIPCWLIYTTPKTHEIINKNLTKSAMYGGLVKGVGPRYCPSIEDKIVRFSDKPRHQLFLEPESYDTNSIYLQGFSTSMPKDIQEEMVHSLPGLENAKILKYAYAIEYDALDPTQFDTSLMVKKRKGLFIAGQICGTSGYEEAAGLGIMAGINAVQYIKGEEPFVLRRDEAYIGVMIDDLITKGTDEPYRLLSSRAEHRLLLRHDNADLRLTDYGYKYGLISKSRYDKFCKKRKNIQDLQGFLEKNHFGEKSSVNEYLNALGYASLTNGCTYKEVLKRNGVEYHELKKYMDVPKELELDAIGERQLSIMVKYEGYIENEKRLAEKNQKLENVLLPQNFDYSKLDGLALEARQKFNKIQPKNIGQASRISGVNPSDINSLILHLRKGDLK